MLKKIGLPIMALAAVMAFAAPPKADARVRFGVAIGGPAYVAPAPAYPYGYGYGYGSGPYYAAPSPYVAPYAYGYSQPYYSTPYYGGGLGFSFGGHRDFDRHEHFERGGHGGGRFEHRGR